MPKRKKSSSGSGKTSRLDGLNQARKIGPTSYSAHPVRETNIKKVPLTSGRVNSLGVLEFQLRLGQNEWGRFLDAPFVAKYYITAENPNYEAPAEGAKAKLAKPTVKTSVEIKYADYKHTKRVVVMPSVTKKENGVFLPPELGFSCFFSHVEVFLDSQKIGDETDMMGQNKVYQALNRIYSSKTRRHKVGQVVVETDIHMRLDKKVIGIGSDGSSAVIKKQISKNQELLAKNTDFAHFEKWKPKTTQFTMDGNFAVAPPFNSALSILRGSSPESNSSGFFPPGTTFVVRLHPRPNKLSLVQFFNQTRKELLNFPGSEDTRVDSVNLEIVDLYMIYESLVLPDELSYRQMGRTLNYPFNRVKLDLCSFEANHMQVLSKSRIPPGAKAMYLTFMKEEHLWFNESSKRNMLNYLHFPKDLDFMKLSLNDHGPLLLKDGFFHLQHEGRSYSSDLKAYYKNEVENKNVTDLKFEDMFPMSSVDHESMTGSLFIDLQKYRLREPSELSIQTGYFGGSEHLSPASTRIVIFYVFDQNLKRSSNGDWTMENLV